MTFNAPSHLLSEQRKLEDSVLYPLNPNYVML
jgi:hypothetical protein